MMGFIGGEHVDPAACRRGWWGGAGGRGGGGGGGVVWCAFVLTEDLRARLSMNEPQVSHHHHLPMQFAFSASLGQTRVAACTCAVKLEVSSDVSGG